MKIFFFEFFLNFFEFFLNFFLSSSERKDGTREKKDTIVYIRA